MFVRITEIVSMVMNVNRKGGCSWNGRNDPRNETVKKKESQRDSRNLLITVRIISIKMCFERLSVIAGHFPSSFFLAARRMNAIEGLNRVG